MKKLPKGKKLSKKKKVVKGGKVPGKMGKPGQCNIFTH